jgi:hypothetical protein
VSDLEVLALEKLSVATRKVGASQDLVVRGWWMKIFKKSRQCKVRQSRHGRKYRNDIFVGVTWVKREVSGSFATASLVRN